MQFCSRSARVALLAGVATLGLAGTASADPVADFDGTGELTVTFQNDENVTLDAANDIVRLNNTPIGIDADDVTRIEVFERGAANANNTVNLAGVGDAFTNLAGTQIRTTGGLDTITGSQESDRIEGGTQNDTMNGAGGDDTLVWNNGEGSDRMDGGDGADTIENNGADAGAIANETYTVDVVNARLLFARAPVNGVGAFTLDVSTAERYVNNMLGGNDSFRTVDPARPVNTILVTLNGGEGDDQLTGTEGGDTLNGGNGADRLVGFRGPDTMNGNDGDDTLVWNNGDASDTMNGGDGIDTVENNGAAADEQYTIDTADGGRFVFARLTQVAFTLNIGGAERLVNNTLAGNDSFRTVDPARPVTGLAVTVNGGEGNDALTGTDGADTINGGAGNDLLTGFKGVDVANGDEGDDTMVWNNGVASDRNEGGAGTDTAVLNGGAADEHIVVTGNGTRVTATRDTQVPFFLDIGTTELLDVNALGGNDAIDVNDNVGKVLATDLAGGDGNDRFRTRNDSVQRIDGGSGADFADVDARDVVVGVERVDRPGFPPPGPPKPQPDTVGPKVAVASKALRVKGGRASLTIACPAGESTCSGKAQIMRGRKVVGSVSVTLAGGERKTFRIALNRRTRIALSRAKGDRLPVTVKVSVKDAAGNSGSASRRLNLRG